MVGRRGDRVPKLAPANLGHAQTGRGGLWSPPPANSYAPRVIADCVCKDNAISEEWLVRDHAAFAYCLGTTPAALAASLVAQDLAARGAVTAFTPADDVPGAYVATIDDSAEAAAAGVAAQTSVGQHVVERAVPRLPREDFSQGGHGTSILYVGRRLGVARTLTVIEPEVAMRPFVLGLFLTMAVLMPRSGSAQVYQFRTAPPDATAAAADWQINSEPIMVGGLVYYPTRGCRFFDGQVMAQTGVFDHVPVYADTTLEPFSVLYVPVSRDRMREYERRRDRELAGTTGSRVPSFPVQSPSVQALRAGTAGVAGTAGSIEPSPRMIALDPSVLAQPQAPEPAAVGTAGTVESRAAAPVGMAGIERRTPSRATLAESAQRPNGPNGVWLDFNGARWYADGAAASFAPDRFEPVGQYRGFPVYRDKAAAANEIWVQVVKDGPLAPYSRR